MKCSGGISEVTRRLPRSRCERAENKNANDMADLAHEMKKSGDALERMGDKKGELETSILQLEKDIFIL